MAYRKSALFGDVGEWAAREFEQIERAVEDFVDVLRLNKLYAEPNPKRDGMIAYADGTTWNPISGGQGVYYYNGSAWVKLG